MFSFLNPWMLLGLALVGAPILIHIFNRSKYRVEAWGAMMFLRKAMQVRSQRIRAEQLILLILRCLFLVLLALALARPIAKWGQGAWDDPTTHLIIFDDSYSMQQGDGEDQAWKKARDTALRVVENMRDKDNMLIIRAGNVPKSLFAKPAYDKRFLNDFIEDLEPGQSQTMDLPKALDQAYYLLSRSTLPRHRMYLLTDGQVHGWREADSRRWEKIQENLEQLKVQPQMYVLKRAPEGDIRNVAINKVYPRSPIVDIYRPTSFLAELNNTTEEKLKIKISFWVDGAMQEERDFDCPVGLQTVDFTYLFPPPPKEEERQRETESHFVEVRLEGDDLAADNSFVYSVEVRHTIPVLVIDGGSTDELWESEAGMIALAIQSAGVYGDEGLFTVKHLPIGELEDLDRQMLYDYRSVVLADVPSLSRNQQFALDTFVADGGGLLIALGEDADPTFYDKWTDGGDGLMPCTMQDVVEFEKDTEPFHPRFPAGVGSQMLDVFDLTRERVLNEVRVTHYWKCEVHSDALALARFNEDPFLIYRPYKEGRVLVWNTSLNTRWTTFPTTQDFLPLTQNLMVYLSAGVRSPINLAQLDTLVYAIPAQHAQTDTGVWENVTLVSPGGAKHALPGSILGGEWVAEWQQTQTTGVYTVEADGVDPQYFAVAYEPGEEDLSRLEKDSEKHFAASVVSRFLVTFNELDAAVQEETGVSEWWRWFVYAALGLLCLELYLAWRFSA